MNYLQILIAKMENAMCRNIIIWGWRNIALCCIANDRFYYLTFLKLISDQIYFLFRMKAIKMIIVYVFKCIQKFIPVLFSKFIEKRGKL